MDTPVDGPPAAQPFEGSSVQGGHQVRPEVVTRLQASSRWTRVYAGLGALEEAVGDLWVAVRPLLIPVAAFLLVATFGLPWSQAILVWLVAIFVINRAVVRPEGDRRRTALRLLVAVALIGFVFTYFGVQVFASILYSVTGAYDPSALLSSVLIWISVAFCLLAIVSRLFAYADSVMRMVTATVFVCFGARVFVAINFPNGDIGSAELAVWWAALGLALGATGLGEALLAAEIRRIEWLFKVRASEGSRWDRNERNAHSCGFVAATLGGVAIVLAAIVGLSADPASGRITEEVSVVSGTTALARAGALPAITDDRALITRFAPALQFDPHEKWMPVTDKAYLRSADLYGATGERVEEHPLLGALPTKCAVGAPLPCANLSIRCDVQESKHRAGCDLEDAPSAAGIYSRGAVYAHVERGRFDPVGPFRTMTGRSNDRPRSTMAAVVQYWLFYNYDDWKAKALTGTLRQTHEADWEAITVGLGTGRSGSALPLFVAMSAHCGGSWARWKDVRIAERGLGNGMLRPVVAVAAGSHANYLRPDATFVPDWAGCIGANNAKVSAASIAYRIRDRTGSRVVLFPKAVPARANELPMSFPGHWGGNARATLSTLLGKQYKLPGGEGPLSPPEHPLWYVPVRTIFCSLKWRPVEGAPADRTGCPG